MKLDLTRLLNSFIEEITFEDTIVFDKEYTNRTEIRELKPVNVSGTITKTVDDLCYLSIQVDGVMILPCSISLEDVEYPFHIDINEILSENIEEYEEYIKISENSIDIFPIIWQNIVMEIPLKVVSPKVNRRNISGEGWKLISEDEEETDESNNLLDNKEER